jgi:methyl-accepting chemotaxis protein
MRYLNALRIVHKLAILTLLFIATFTAFGLFSYSTVKLVEVNGPIYTQVAKGKDLLADVLPPDLYIVEARMALFEMSVETDQKKIAALVEEVADHHKKLDDCHAKWAQQLPNGPMKDALEKSYALASQWFDLTQREYAPLVRSGHRKEAEELRGAKIAPLFYGHREAVEELVKQATAYSSNFEAQAAEATQSRSRLMIELGLTAVALMALFCWFLGRAIVGALTELVATAERLAAGDLTVTVEQHSQDEIGRLSGSLQRMVETLRGIIGQAAGSASSMASSSEELSAVSTQMGSNAEATSTQSGMVAAAAEQVSKSVQTVATGAEEMMASIKEIAKYSSEAAQVAAQAVKVAETTNATVAKLGESSNEIGQVIKVITSIAQQTNLLALNATIEAARAGESGKGFAVVANEVKELAKETARATEEISRKIETIQGDTAGAVNAISEIDGIIHRISDIQNTIASAVEEQSATTNEIGRNITEAAKGTTEIAQNINGVAQAAKSTAEGAGNSQAAATELSRMASELQKTVGQFKLGADAPASTDTKRGLRVVARRAA